MSWFIDAWAVRDGLAFASERQGDDVLQRVHLAAPEFVATPIASGSTALAAARGHFQSGYFDESGNEVEFKSLEQVREAVRRGFLAGGRGLPSPPIGSAPQGPPPESPQAPPPVLPNDSDERSRRAFEWQEIIATARTMREPAEREALARMLVGAWGRSEEQIWQFVRETVDDMGAAEQHAQTDAERLRCFRDRSRWMTLLVKGHLYPPGLIRRGPPDFPEYEYWLGSEGEALSMSGVLFAVPLHPHWRGTMAAETLGDALCEMAADRSKLGPDSSSIFVPLLVVAMVVVAESLQPRVSAFYGGPSQKAFQAVAVHEAARWLARELPGAEFEGHALEGHIARMLLMEPKARLEEDEALEEGPPTRGPPSSRQRRGQPGGEGGMGSAS